MTFNKCPGIEEDLIIITGPTATGKTSIAQEIARDHGAEIISADSGVFYKDLKIGTGAYTIDEIKTHMVGFLELNDRFSLYDYMIRTSSIIKDIRRRKKKVIICGGTMLYIERLIKGMDDLPPPDPEYRKEMISILNNKGKNELHSILMNLDPDLGRKVHPNNVKRVIRSLEIARRINIQRPIGGLEGVKGIYFIMRDKEEIKKRIVERVHHMLDIKWVEEVEDLLSKGATGNEAGFESMGYQEIISHIKGEIGYSKMVDRIIEQHLKLYNNQIKWKSRIPSSIIDVTESSHVAAGIEF